MLIVYLMLSTALLFTFAIVWVTTTWPNTLIKLTLYATAVLGFIVLLSQIGYLIKI